MNIIFILISALIGGGAGFAIFDLFRGDWNVFGAILGTLLGLYIANAKKR